jgi:CRISPR-associated protein Cmr3
MPKIMSKTKNALVSFTPLEPFFFGGENTHGSPGANANYFAQSNLYPQQTTLLGALRNLLRLSGYAYGLQSFAPHDANLSDFGDLLQLSPLFLQQKDGDNRRYFLRQALDRHGDNSPAFSLVTDTNDEWLLFDGSDQFLPTARWTGYNPKKSLADEWVAASGERVDPDSIFNKIIRPGIPKSELHNRTPNSPGLFKQELIHLSPGWSFAVVATFDEKVNTDDLHGMTLQLGGENSLFSIAVQETAQTFEQLFPAKDLYYTEQALDFPRIVLVSDADVPDTAWAHTIAAVTETCDFRHLQTHISLKRVGKMERFGQHQKSVSEASPLAKSAKFTLLKRGSVLVCADNQSLDALCATLLLEPWRTVGFNHYVTCHTSPI